MYWLKPDAVLVEGTLRPDVCVLVSGGDGEGTILSVGAPLAHDGVPVIPLPKRVLLPGFVNAHSHAFHRALRGWVQHAAPGMDGGEAWREAMFSLASRLDPEALEAVSTLAFAEMVRAGFTSVGEVHELHHQADGTPYADPDELALRIAASARRVGLRMVLLRGARAVASPREARFVDAAPDAPLAAIARLRARGLDVGLSPVDALACPPAWLRAFSTAPVVIHARVGADPGEDARCRAATGRSAVELLADTGLLGPRFTAVHTIHTDADGRRLLHDTQAGVCACPTSALDLGSGFFPAAEVDAPLCIGTDSQASIDPFAELRALEWNARAAAGRRDVTAHLNADGLAATLLQRGTEHGARALGLHTGRIAPGYPADLVAIDTARLEFGASRLLPAIVFNGSPAAVRDAWVGGRHVVRDGRVPGGEAIVAEAERALRRIAHG